MRNLAAVKRDLRYILIASSVLYSLTVLEHVPRFDSIPSMPVLIAFRVAVLGLAASLLISVRRSLTAISTRILVMVYMTTFGVSEAYELYAGVSVWSHGAFPVVVIMVLVFYFFVRFNLRFQIAAGALVSTIYTVTVATTQGGPVIEYSSVALLFLLVNVIGVYHYVSTENRARREFELLLEERTLTRQLREETAINERLFQELKRRSTTDHLTGLANRGAFEEHLRRHHALAQRHERPLSLILLDLDRFKQINDRFGHPVGDEVLRDVAEVLRDTARGEDLAGRLGGDELGVILPETTNDGAAAIAKRVLEALHKKTVRPDRSGDPIRASLGVATLRPDESVDQIWERTDRALYRAKTDGRDRIFNCGTDPACAQYATI